MDEQTVRRIFAEEFAKIFHSDKYHFSRDMQIANGRNIELGKGTGTMIGTETTQKLGFFAKGPRAQYPFVGFPSGGATVDAQARSSASDALNILIEFGFMASS